LVTTGDTEVAEERLVILRKAKDLLLRHRYKLIRTGGSLRVTLAASFSLLSQFSEISRQEIEMVLRPNDADAEMAEGELAALLDVVGIIEAHRLPAVDERHATGAGDLAYMPANDE
jgi:hypothetical protein